MKETGRLQEIKNVRSVRSVSPLMFIIMKHFKL